MIAIGADDGLGESNGCVAARPVERRLKNNFFRWITLRFVEARGGLRFTEYIGDAVITDSIAGPEVTVRVVIEGAPANAPGILRVGRELVMDAGMTQRVLGEALDLVNRLGRIRVPDEFSIQIARMIRR